jgi:hypothetical protein
MSDENFVPLGKEYFEKILKSIENVDFDILFFNDGNFQKNDQEYKRMMLALAVQQNLLLDKISHILMLAYGMDISDDFGVKGDDNTAEPVKCPKCKRTPNQLGYCSFCNIDVTAYYTKVNKG